MKYRKYDEAGVNVLKIPIVDGILYFDLGEA